GCSVTGRQYYACPVESDGAACSWLSPRPEMNAPRSSRLVGLLRSWRLRLVGKGWAELTGMALGVLAVALAIGVGCHGIAGLFPNGHFASTAAIGMTAQNMWHWKTALPIVGYVERGPFSYYMHHPLGVFWVAALFGKV